MLGADSCVVHWHYPDGTAEVFSHSGYFSGEQLDRYALGFAHLDPWAIGAAGAESTNRAMNVEELVPSSQYERSTFYNEYVHSMGDDSSRCIDLRVETPFGSGMISLRRGKSQPPFDEPALRMLEHHVPHVRRLLILRGRLGGAEQRAARLEMIVEALAPPTLLVDANGCLLQANTAAEAMLRHADGLMVADGRVVASCPSLVLALQCGIAAVVAREGAPAKAIALPRPEGGELWLSLVGVAAGPGTRHALICSMADRVDPTLERRLRDLFGLSAREAAIAVRLADGTDLPTIAEERQVAINTVRSQVKSVAAKLGCRRQSEIVALVKRLPRFNGA